jgi:RNA polymerase sigma-70 factor, ECF subfamily
LALIVEPADSEDAALVQAVGRREQDAMATLYARHAKAVFDYARCTIWRSLAEDVVQDVFVRLWKQPERFDPTRGTVRIYLLTLARGRSIDIARSESSRRLREKRDGQRQGPIAVDSLETTWTHADEVRAALAQLRPEQREAITLAYFLGHSYREVATVLDTPEGTIKNRIRTGLARLRVELSGVEPEMTP